MTEARQQDNWSRTSALMCLVANTNRDPKKTRTFRPDDFNPFASRRPAVVPKVGIGILKKVFVDNRQPER